MALSASRCARERCARDGRSGQPFARLANYTGVVLRYRIHPGQVTVIRQKQQRENMIQVFQEYSASFLEGELAIDPGYMLVADKQLAIDEAGIYRAVAFMHKIILRYGDPEGVVSTNAYIFFTRCGGLGLRRVMREARRFHIRPKQKIVLMFLLLLAIAPTGRVYQALNRLR